MFSLANGLEINEPTRCKSEHSVAVIFLFLNNCRGFFLNSTRDKLKKRRNNRIKGNQKVKTLRSIVTKVR